MSKERVESNQKWLAAFADAARNNQKEAVVVFKNYVSLLGGNFDLAVLNVGDKFFSRVLAHEGLITLEERRAKQGIFEAISKARDEMNPQEMVLCY